MKGFLENEELIGLNQALRSWCAAGGEGPQMGPGKEQLDNFMAIFSDAYYALAMKSDRHPYVPRDYQYHLALVQALYNKGFSPKQIGRVLNKVLLTYGPEYVRDSYLQNEDVDPATQYRKMLADQLVDLDPTLRGDALERAVVKLAYRFRGMGTKGFKEEARIHEVVSLPSRELAALVATSRELGFAKKNLSQVEYNARNQMLSNFAQEWNVNKGEITKEVIQEYKDHIHYMATAPEFSHLSYADKGRLLFSIVSKANERTPSKRNKKIVSRLDLLKAFVEEQEAEGNTPSVEELMQRI